MCWAHALIEYLVRNVEACMLNGELALRSVLSLTVVEKHMIYNLCTLTSFGRSVPRRHTAFLHRRCESVCLASTFILHSIFDLIVCWSSAVAFSCDRVSHQFVHPLKRPWCYWRLTNSHKTQSPNHDIAHTMIIRTWHRLRHGIANLDQFGRNVWILQTFIHCGIFFFATLHEGAE